MDCDLGIEELYKEVGKRQSRGRDGGEIALGRGEVGGRIR